MSEEKILALLQAEPDRGYTLPEILKKAGVEEEDGKSVRRVLKGLVKRGVLERERGRTFRLSRAGQEVTGTIGLDERTGAHVVVDDGAAATPRPKRDARSARSAWIVSLAREEVRLVEASDRVRVRLSPTPGRRGRLEARIVEVLDRPKARVFGTFRRIAKLTFVELEADEKSQRQKRGRARPIQEVLVAPEDSMDAADGALVELELSRKGQGPSAVTSAKVTRVLGKPGERETELRRLMIDHGLDTGFPPDAEQEAASFPEAPTEADMAGRRDLRDLPLVTIDGETAKDFDDAVSVVRRGTDGYTLFVAIADVAHYVRPGTPIDREAVARGTSTYLTDRAIPMLPEALSNRLCSLMPAVDRLCLVAEMEVDRTGHVEKTTLYPAVMRSHARLTYTRVARALDGEPDEECTRLLPTLMLLFKVAALLLERRLKRGALDLDVAEPFVVFDENHFPCNIERRPRNDAHRMIEDLMLVANESVATWFVEQKLPSIFRIHEDPDPDKLQIFVALCHHLGIPAKLKRHPRPADVASLLERLDDHPTGNTLNSMLLRSLMQARYDVDCKGHYGLAAERYLHFTSPIRRYPDLMVHRLVKRLLSGKDLGYSREQLQEIAQRSSEAERRAMAAERESMDLDRAYVALEHLGETMPAVVTAVQGFGLFAATKSPFLEGLLPVHLLPEDYYEVDEYNAALRGATTGRTFAIGQELEVKIAAVSLQRRKVELHLATGGAEPGERRERSRRGPDRSPPSGRRAAKPGAKSRGGRRTGGQRSKKR